MLAALADCYIEPWPGWPKHMNRAQTASSAKPKSSKLAGVQTKKHDLKKNLSYIVDHVGQMVNLLIRPVKLPGYDYNI